MTDYERIRALRAKVKQAAEIFRRYEQIHAAKGPPGFYKAVCNAELAEQMEQTLADTE